MNYIILLLEFIVLVISIGLFIAKKTDSPTGPTYDINWNIALIIAALFMIALNAALVCRGVFCFFTCGDESPQVAEAKKAVAIYRRVKAGQSAKAGVLGYGNVDLNHLEDDPDEANIFVGIEDPVEIRNLADAATKTFLKNKVAQRANLVQNRANARIGELDTNLGRRNILIGEGAAKVPAIPAATAGTGGVVNKFGNLLKQGDDFSRDLFFATQKTPAKEKTVPVKNKKISSDQEAAMRAANPELFESDDDRFSSAM